MTEDGENTTPRRGGQRKLSEKKRKKNFLDVGFTEADYNDLRTLCESLEVPMATFAREAILERVGKVRKSRA